MNKGDKIQVSDRSTVFYGKIGTVVEVLPDTKSVQVKWEDYPKTHPGDLLFEWQVDKR
jgi:ribosomal protein L24